MFLRQGLHFLHPLFVLRLLFHKHFHLLLLLEYLTLEHAHSIFGLQKILFSVLVALFSNGECLLGGNEVGGEFGNLFLRLGDLDFGYLYGLPLFSLAAGFVFDDFFFQRIDFIVEFVIAFFDHL